MKTIFLSLHNIKLNDGGGENKWEMQIIVILNEMNK